MNFRGPQLLVTLVFGAMILSAGGIQVGIELGRGEKPRMLELFRRAPTAAHLRAYEENLESESWLANQLRPWMQHALFTVLDDPGPKTVRGRAGWFFYRPGVEYLTQRPPTNAEVDDPVAAICDYRDQLAARGIRLIVMPAPNKESIYPEQLTRRADALSLAVGPTTRSLCNDCRPPVWKSWTCLNSMAEPNWMPRSNRSLPGSRQSLVAGGSRRGGTRCRGTSAGSGLGSTRQHPLLDQARAHRARR